MTERRRAERFAKNLDEPDETLTFPFGISQNVRMGEMVVGRLVQEPGWRRVRHPPGHDQWIIGDEPAVAIIWGGWRGFGKVPAGERVLRTLLMTDIAG